MRKLDYNESLMCKITGQVFEKSVEYSNLSSPMFIKRFMNYEGARSFFDMSYLLGCYNEEDIILEMNKVYTSMENKVLYDGVFMNFIGRLYMAIYYLTKIPPKAIQAMFTEKDLRTYFVEAFDLEIEDAALKALNDKGYSPSDKMKKGLEILKKLKEKVQ